MKKKIAFFAAALFIAASVHAQQTYQELEQITVNEQVTTLVTLSLCNSEILSAVFLIDGYCDS